MLSIRNNLSNNIKPKTKVVGNSLERALKRGKPVSEDYTTPGCQPIHIEGTDLMTFLRRDAAKQLNTDNRAELFDRNSRNRVFSGSILKVKYQTCTTTKSHQTFIGALIAYRRSLPDTTFLLRNLIAGVGVEMNFHLFSPMIKSIEVLKLAKPGRCKLYHLREKPKLLLAGLEQAISKHEAQTQFQEQQPQAATHIVVLKKELKNRDSFNRIGQAIDDDDNSEMINQIDLGAGMQGYIASLTPERIASLKTEPDVAFVEPNVVVKAAATQLNAPYNLARLSKRLLPLRNPYYYSDKAGAGIDCYIVDSGVLTSHVEFEGRATFGATFTGDGNTDMYGHGTHVAGIVASKTYGVAKKANIIAVKVLNNRGIGNWASVISGLNWVYQRQKTTKRKSIVNLSISGPVSEAVNQAVAALLDAGIIVVSAAGNDGADSCMYSPGSSTSSITVGASDRNDKRLLSPPSNIGACIDIVAPGSVVISTYIGSNTATAYMSGTSMAAPHVVGVIALAWADKNIPVDPILDFVLGNATPNLIQGFDQLAYNALAYNQ